MPALFIGHGSPMNALADNRFTAAWRRLGAALPRPRAILVVSAHWHVPGTAVTAMARPATLHDVHGFPESLFAFRYPAPGSPELAARVRQCLAPLRVAADHDWGLDHGAWSVLAHLFPAADVPVVQLSMDSRQPAQFHYYTGRRLAVLREEGVLILASGGIVHNLGLLQPVFLDEGFDWARAFEGAVRQRLLDGDHAALVDWPGLGEAARLAVPTPEHYLPLLYLVGAQEKGEKVSFPVEGFVMGSLGMLSIAIGDL